MRASVPRFETAIFIFFSSSQVVAIVTRSCVAARGGFGPSSRPGSLLLRLPSPRHLELVGERAVFSPHWLLSEHRITSDRFPVLILVVRTGNTDDEQGTKRVAGDM